MKKNRSTQKLRDFNFDQRLVSKKDKTMKNGYEFPMTQAIQCIPEFNGSADELEPFLLQIDHFANRIPEGESEQTLLNVVLMKLKGKAASYINRIRSDSWHETRNRIRDQFSKKITVEQILQQIETLEQKDHESFRDYADRALRIKEYLDHIRNPQAEENASFAERSLKIHFIGGLRNRNLKQAAKSQRPGTFIQLIRFLEEVYVECEQLESIEHRLRSCRISANQPQSTFINRNPNNIYSRHQFKPNSYNANFNQRFPSNNLNRQQPSQSNYTNQNRQNIYYPPNNNNYRQYNSFNRNNGTQFQSDNHYRNRENAPRRSYNEVRGYQSNRDRFGQDPNDYYTNNQRPGNNYNRNRKN